MQAGCFRLNQHFPSLPVTPAEYPYSVFEIIVFYSNMLQPIPRPLVAARDQFQGSASVHLSPIG